MWKWWRSSCCMKGFWKEMLSSVLKNCRLRWSCICLSLLVCLPVCLWAVSTISQKVVCASVWWCDVVHAETGILSGPVCISTCLQFSKGCMLSHFGTMLLLLLHTWTRHYLGQYCTITCPVGSLLALCSTFIIFALCYSLMFCKFRSFIYDKF